MPQEQLFQVDLREHRRLQKMWRRMPKEFKQATAGMLNSFAFGTQKKAVQVINRRMTVRSPKFVKSSVRVNKARGNKSIDSQRSETGSIARARFSGWVEQEKGKASRRRRIPETFARGGDPGRKVRPSLRMRSSNQFRSPDDFPGKNSEHRVIVMLQMLKRERHRKPFIIKHHRRFKPGLYKFHRRKLRRVQLFNVRERPPRRIRWLTTARHWFFAKADIRGLWTDNLKHVKKRVRRK